MKMVNIRYLYILDSYQSDSEVNIKANVEKSKPQAENANYLKAMTNFKNRPKLVKGSQAKPLTTSESESVTVKVTVSEGNYLADNEYTRTSKNWTGKTVTTNSNNILEMKSKWSSEYIKLLIA